METQEVVKQLRDRGLTPVIMKDEDDPSIDHVFIEKDVVWDKLFTSLKMIIDKERKESKTTNDFYKSIRHINWIKRLIIAHNPKLDWVEIPNKGFALAVVWPKMQKKNGRLPKTNEQIQKLFVFVRGYISQVLDETLGTCKK